MKSESLLAVKGVVSQTQQVQNNSSSSKVKAEGGGTIIKNFQSHNVHFQHFMKQQGITAPASSNQLKKEHLRSAKVKQESIPLTGSRRENREHHNNTLSAEKTYIKSGKKASKKLKQESHQHNCGGTPSS